MCVVLAALFLRISTVVIQVSFPVRLLLPIVVFGGISITPEHELYISMASSSDGEALAIPSSDARASILFIMNLKSDNCFRRFFVPSSSGVSLSKEDIH